jgi:NADH dehydrogenase FAD-containing subunit
LKSLEDAIELRRRILSAFEAAEMASLEEERRAALTFVVVGAGPTGVCDMACFEHQTGQPLLGVGPVAMQMGRRASRNILLLIEGKKTKPFRYFDKGAMATIGRNKAIADLKVARFGGHLAWLSWQFVHLIFLVGFRSRLLVLFHRTWSYLTFGCGARLIYGSFKPRKEPVPEESDVPGLV